MQYEGERCMIACCGSVRYCDIPKLEFVANDGRDEIGSKHIFANGTFKMARVLR